MCRIVFFLLSLAIISVLKNDGFYVAAENRRNNTDIRLASISKTLSNLGKGYNKTAKNRLRRSLVLFVPENDETKYQDAGTKDLGFQSRKTKRCKSNGILHQVKFSLPPKENDYANKEGINLKNVVQRDIMLPNTEDIENGSVGERPNVKLVSLKELKTPLKSILGKKNLRKNGNEDSTAVVKALKESLRATNNEKTMLKERKEGLGDQKNYVCYCREENCQGKNLEKEPSDVTQLPYVKQSLQLRKGKPNRKNQKLITNDENRLRNAYKTVNRPENVLVQQKAPITQERSKIPPNLLLPIGARTVAEPLHQNLNNYHILPVYQHVPAGLAIPLTKKDPSGGLRVGLPLPRHDDISQEGNSDEESYENLSYAEGDGFDANPDDFSREDDSPPYLGQAAETRPDKFGNYLNFEDCNKMYGREFCVISGKFTPPPIADLRISDSIEDCSDDFPNSFQHASKNALEGNRYVQTTRKNDRYSTKNLPPAIFATTEPSAVGITSGMENVDKSNLGARSKQNFRKNSGRDEYYRDDNLVSYTDYETKQTTHFYDLNAEKGNKYRTDNLLKNSEQVGQSQQHLSPTGTIHSNPHCTKPYTEKPVIVGLTGRDYVTSTFKLNTNEAQLKSELSTVDGGTKTFSQAGGNFQTSLAKQSLSTLGDYLTSTSEDSSKAEAMTIKYITFHKSDGGGGDVTNVYCDTNNPINDADSPLGNTLNTNIADSEMLTSTSEYSSMSFTNDGTRFNIPTTVKLDVLETTTDPIDGMVSNNVVTKTPDTFVMETSGTYPETFLPISTMLKESATDARVAQATKSPTLGKSKAYTTNRKEFDPNGFSNSKYTSESTESQSLSLNEGTETNTIVGITNTNSEENNPDESSTLDYNTDLLSNTGAWTAQPRIFTDSELFTTSPYELDTESNNIGRYSALSIVPTTDESAYAEEITQVPTILSDEISTEDSLVGTALITNNTVENPTQSFSDMYTTTDSSDIIGIALNTTGDYSNDCSIEETSWAQTDIFYDQPDVTEAYTITSDTTENIVGIASGAGSGTDICGNVFASQDGRTTESVMTSTDLQNNSLPFCDNTLLMNTVKMVLNDFALNKSTKLDEYVNLPLEDLRTRTENLVPEILSISNLKEFLREPRVENMIVGNIQTFLSRLTGIQEHVFAKDGVRKIMQDALRNVGLMMPGLQDQNKLPPMTVEERRFKDGEWTTNLATLVPGVQTRKPNAWDNVKNVMRELIDHPAVGATRDLKPTLKNIILATAKNTMEKGETEGNNTKIDDVAIQDVLENMLLHEHPIDIDKIRANDEPSPKNVQLAVEPTNYSSSPNSETVEENITMVFSKATKSDEEVSVMGNNKDQLFSTMYPYQKATAFTKNPKILTPFNDSVSSEELVGNINENSTEGSPTTLSTEYSELYNNTEVLDYALLGESNEKPNNIEHEEVTQINDQNESAFLSDSPENLPTKYYSPKDRILNYIKNHPSTAQIEVSEMNREPTEESAVVVGKSIAAQAIVKSILEYDTTISGTSNVPPNTSEYYGSDSDSHSEANNFENSTETSTEQFKETSSIELTTPYFNDSTESIELLSLTNTKDAQTETMSNNNDDLSTMIGWSSTEKPTTNPFTSSESSSEDYKFKLTTPDLYEFVAATASEGKLQADLNIASGSNKPKINVNKPEEVESEEISPTIYEPSVKTHEITTETRKTVTKTTVYHGLKNSFTANPIVSQRQNVYCENKTIENEEMVSTYEAPGYPESEESLMYLGKIIPNAPTNPAEDVSGLLHSNLYYVGDGVRLPLEIKKLKDGSYGLSISEKICQRVMKKKCPCCVPLEGSIMRTSEGKTDVDNNTKRLIRKSNNPEAQTKVSRYSRDGKKLSQRRSKRSSLPNLKESEATSMPVIDFARKYNLSLNLDEEKITNSGENTTNVEFQDSKSVTREFSPPGSKINKKNNSVQSTSTTEKSELNTDKETEKTSYNKNKARARKFNNRNEPKKKRRAQYRYQRNVDEDARKRTKALKSILFWLKDLFVPDNSNPL